MSSQNIRYAENLAVHFDAKSGNPYGHAWGEAVPDAYEFLELFHPEWHQRAACRGMGPELFFRGQSESAAEGKAVCRGCEVRAECLAQVQTMETQGNHGTWGGLTPKERRGLPRVKRDAPHGSDSRYKSGCHCVACTEAHRVAHRHWRGVPVSSPPDLSQVSVSASSPLSCGDDAESLGAA